MWFLTCPPETGPPVVLGLLTGWTITDNPGSGTTLIPGQTSMIPEEFMRPMGFLLVSALLSLLSLLFTAIYGGMKIMVEYIVEVVEAEIEKFVGRRELFRWDTFANRSRVSAGFKVVSGGVLLLGFLATSITISWYYYFHRDLLGAEAYPGMSQVLLSVFWFVFALAHVSLIGTVAGWAVIGLRMRRLVTGQRKY